MSNILSLHRELKTETYQPGGYEHFVVTDPKRRDIHKASVRDRLVHHAIYRILYQFYDSRFIPDSYSCRNKKGTHRAMNKFSTMAGKVSHNHTKTVLVLKSDIRKFFASIDHQILFQILDRDIRDTQIMNLLQLVLDSFHTTQTGKGLPLGNLTSQLLVNIYMNEFDQYLKHTLKIKHYIRYADDFVVLCTGNMELVKILLYIEVFLQNKLGLELHPHKVSIATFASGVDFLGWVHFSRHRVIRTVTKRRMVKRLAETEFRSEVVNSYRGLLSYGNTHQLSLDCFTTVRKDALG